VAGLEGVDENAPNQTRLQLRSHARIEFEIQRDDLVEQAVIIGESKPYVTALIVPDWAVVTKRIPGRPEDLVHDERVISLIGNSVDAVNQRVGNWEAVKQFIARPRPPGYNSSVLGVVYSFPSGHVLEAITIYGMIAVLVWRSSLAKAVRVIIPVIFTLIIVLVAIARIATGDHYPSDVLAGAVAGIAFVAFFSWLTDLIGYPRPSKQA